MHRMSFFICFVVTSVFCFFAPAFAAVEIHPRITLGEEYNDNIYLDDRGEEEDWITTIEPGIQLLYNNRSVAATVDYSLRYEFYKNNDQENIDDFKDVQRADASILFFDGRPFTLRIGEIISREELDESRNNAEYNDLVNRSTVYRTTVNPQYRLEFARIMALVFGYNYDRVDYVDPRGNDTEEHTGSASLERALSSATTVYGTFAYRVLSSDDPADDFDRNDYVIGFRHQLGTRTSLAVEGGYSTVEYDSGYDTDSTIWNGSLSYQLTAALAASLSLAQDFTVSAEDGLAKTRRAEFGFHYLKEQVSVDTSVYGNKSDYVRLDREDTAYGFRAGLSRQFSNYFTGHINGEIEWAEYQDQEEDEDVSLYTVAVSLDYAYRRFLASCGYRYRINNSDVDGNDYTNNVIFLSGTMRF